MLMGAFLCVCSVMSNSLRPHGLQPARLLCPWNFPGKSTAVGYYSLLQSIVPTRGLNTCLNKLLGLLQALAYFQSSEKVDFDNFWQGSHCFYRGGAFRGPYFTIPAEVNLLFISFIFTFSFFFLWAYFAGLRLPEIDQLINFKLFFSKIYIWWWFSC